MKRIDIFSGTDRVYNLDCTHVTLEGSQANLMGCVLAPGEASEAHNHFENELFVFADGTGTVSQDGETVAVKAADAVLFDRFENHIITNSSATEPLRFHSIYWAANAANAPQTSTKSALVFSTPPTPNGDLHLGHLSGPYLGADTLVRSLRAQGRTVRHVTGRDDNQTYVLTCGVKEGRSPEETAHFYNQKLRQTWAAFGVGIDGYIDPTETPRYADFLRHGISALVEKGLIVARIEPAAYDADGNYLHEAYISGGCPQCGEASDGNACEACGRPNACVDLTNARVKLTGGAVHTAPATRLYFRLSAFGAELAQYVKSADMPAHVAALSLDMIADGLPDICISHPSHWGLLHDVPDFADQRIYVWFEMAFGYLWGAAARPDAAPQDVLTAAAALYDGGTDIVHCYGFDNAYYHTLLFPAVHLALGLTPARTHIVNELLDLDGKKFSTSRRHLIWGRDFAAAVPRDYARFALMLNRPEGTRENFTVDRVAASLMNLFPNQLTGWIDRFLTRMGLRLNVLPEPGAWLADHRVFHGWLMTQADVLTQAETVATFSPRRIAQVIEAIIREGARFSAAQDHLLRKPHPGTGNYARTALALEAMSLAVLARACRAVMPDLSSALTAMLGQTPASAADFLTGGQTISPVHRPVLPELVANLAEAIAPGPEPVLEAAK